MDYNCYQVCLIAFGAFFAFTQGIVAIIVSTSPQDSDQAIIHAKHLYGLTNLLIYISIVSLVGMLSSTWVYFVNYFGIHGLVGYAVSGASTILGITTIVVLWVTIRRIWQIRLHPLLLIKET